VSSQAQEATWTVVARPAEAGPLRRMVTAFATDVGMPEQRLHELTLAVGEAIANAVLHAYRNRPLGIIDVTAAVRDGDLVIAVRDEGCGLLPRPDSPGLGLGLGLIAQIADALWITQGDSGTELCMAFALPVNGASAAPLLRDASAPPRRPARVRAP
jgi:anti-sigma regulatory factor (Ser/Thr protein kinase)